MKNRHPAAAWLTDACVHVTKTRAPLRYIGMGMVLTSQLSDHLRTNRLPKLRKKEAKIASFHSFGLSAA